ATVRLGLTGCLDQQLPAELAFGILTKPCPLALLEATVTAAAQFHALRATRPLAPAPTTASALPAVESGLHPLPSRAAADAPRRGAAPSIPAARACRLALAVLGTSVELGPRATRLGRAMDNDIVIQDARIALRHLRFFRSWRGVTVQDLSGTGVVQLNGARLSGVRFIQPGDCIGLGPFDVSVSAVDDGRPAAH
ncbi:MAG TPA: FHA domain-containing protein, partial [Polyangiaceae bacterium]|nr:FHA domain-containing protein [Polyangiaceae bacterium]